MKTKLPISDERMLKLMDYVIDNGDSPNESKYLESIKFTRTNISNVRRGYQSFNRDHIRNACELTGANANWIFGFENNMMRKEQKKLSPIERIKEALVELEASLGEDMSINKIINTAQKKTTKRSSSKK